MTLISLIIVVAVIGVILWAIETYVPMPLVIKRLLEGLVVIILLLWILQLFGLLGPIGSVKIR